MVRVVVVTGVEVTGPVRYLNPAQVMWVQEGGPGYCTVQMAMPMDDGSHVNTSFRVLGPAQDLAKRLATSEPSQAEDVA